MNLTVQGESAILRFMPLIKSAIKKMRQDKVKTVRNARVKRTLREVLKKTRKNPTAKNLQLAYKTLDKTAKNNIIHKNKASRLKSRLTKLTAK